MTEDMVMYIGRRMLETSLLISAPVLVVATVVGIVTAILQAVTSVRDQTFGMVIKLAAVGLTVLLAGGWMLQKAVDVSIEMFHHMQALRY